MFEILRTVVRQAGANPPLADPPEIRDLTKAAILQVTDLDRRAELMLAFHRQFWLAELKDTDDTELSRRGHEAMLNCLAVIDEMENAATDDQQTGATADAGGAAGADATQVATLRNLLDSDPNSIETRSLRALVERIAAQSADQKSDLADRFMSRFDHMRHAFSDGMPDSMVAVEAKQACLDIVTLFERGNVRLQ